VSALLPALASELRSRRVLERDARSERHRASHDYYNLCRVREALRTMPAVAPGIANRVWTIGDLLDAALAEPPGCELNL
jgi:hypothetical protein